MNKNSEIDLLYDEDNVPQVAKTLLSKMTEAAKYILAGKDIGRYEISLSFASVDLIQSLNSQYRSIDSPTDVLSFPLDDERMLGDVIICTEIAEEHATEYGHSTEREIIYLFVHGLLHLLGYDHEDETDRKAMRQREEEVMEHIGVIR